MTDISEGTALAQAKSMQIPKRWPLVNTLNSRDGNFLKDARLVNAYAEKDPDTGEHQVEKRPGFSPAPVIAATVGPGQGIFAYSFLNPAGSVPHIGYISVVLYIQNSVAYVTSVNTDGSVPAATNLGAVQVNGAYNFLSTKCKFIGLPFGGGGSVVTILFGAGAQQIGGGTLAYYFDSALHTLTPGVNGFPAFTVPGFVYLNGFTYVMDISGTIWETTTQNQVANWGALAFISAATDSDFGVILARQLIYVVAVKSWTTQFFYDAGNTTGSSLSPVPGALFNFGCLSSDTFQEFDDLLIWATQSKNGTYRIVLVKNLELTFISNSAVERQLDLGPGSKWYSLAYQHAGHRWYVISNVTTNVTMVYDVNENLWYIWTDFQGNVYPVIDRTSPWTGAEWHQMAATGAVYKLASDYVYPNDFGNIVPVDIYTPNFDGGVDRGKVLSQMRFNADQTPGSKLWTRFSDDDYGHFNNYRAVDLSRLRPILSDEGTFYRRAYHFRHYANTGLRIKSVDLQMDLGIL